MLQLICHLFGDYVLQNHWMANEKTKSSWPALVHALFYCIPFALLIEFGGGGSWWSLAVIGSTHFLIDRFRLARYWVDFWGVGNGGWIMPKLTGKKVDPAPAWLGVWLLIIVDNTVHLGINYAALALL